MIILILSILLIGFAVLERILYIKKDKSLYRIRLFIGILITFLLFLISYFITDSTTGMLYIFISMSFFILIGLVNYRSSIEWLKYTLHIIGIPFMTCLLLKAVQNMLIDPQYIFLLLLIVNPILSYSYKRKGTKKENISLAIGILIVIASIFFYSKASDTEGTIILRQESVAQKYLEEELDIDEAYVYMDRFSIKLRGEETTVRAHDSSGVLIEMIYKNGKIISYDIKNNQ